MHYKFRKHLAWKVLRFQAEQVKDDAVKKEEMRSGIVKSWKEMGFLSENNAQRFCSSLFAPKRKRAQAKHEV